MMTSQIVLADIREAVVKKQRGGSEVLGACGGQLAVESPIVVAGAVAQDRSAWLVPVRRPYQSHDDLRAIDQDLVAVLPDW